MALSPEDPRFEIQEEGGGEVKPFLDHLEDLRWTLVKSVTAIGIAMVVCLAGANYIMDFLLLPLQKAGIRQPNKEQKRLLIYVGTNVLSDTIIGTNQPTFYEFGTNRLLQLELAPAPVSGRMVMALQPMIDPPEPPKTQAIINITPVGGFVVAFKVAMYGGIVLASPFVFYFILQFILPALKQKEKSVGGKILGLGLLLFFSGVSFCYFVLMPLALHASQGYSEWLGIGAEMWTAESYISFVCMFMLGMGIGFQMPIVVLTLVKIGIVDYKALAGFRRYMIVINLVLGGLLTTPEVITQVLMFVPLQLLYELSVWIAWYWERRDRKLVAKEDES